MGIPPYAFRLSPLPVRPGMLRAPRWLDYAKVAT